MIWWMRRENKQKIKWFIGFSEINFKEPLIFLVSIMNQRKNGCVFI